MTARHYAEVAASPSEETAEETQGLVTAVLLCGQLATYDTGLDVWELRRWLRTLGPGVRAAVTPDLCHAPKTIAPALRGAAYALLAVCSSDFAEPEARQQLQRAGLDPLNAPVLNLGAYASHVPQRRSATEKAKLLLAGAVARVQNSPHLGPRHRRPVLAPLGQKVSRRALFTVPPVRYQPVATPSEKGCLAEAGCDVCLQTCPRNALAIDGARLRVEKDRCDGCGACVAACPSAALELAGSGPRELAAQLTALLGPVAENPAGRSVVFLCPQAAGAVEAAGSKGIGAFPGVLPVEAPCVAAIPTSLLLQVAAEGAQACLASCPKACAYGQTEAIRDRVDYCRKLLANLGRPHDGVCFLDPNLTPVNEGATASPAPAQTAVVSARPPLHIRPGMEGLAPAVVALAADADLERTAALEHTASPFGLITLDASACTGCGSCAEACPTGAMKRDAGEKTTWLSFDARTCIACGRCVEACPEAKAGAIRMARATDPARLAAGRTRVFEDTALQCLACGAPVMSTAMLGRLRVLLGEKDGRLAEHLGRYCANCRANR